MGLNSAFKGLNGELNPICHLLALLGGATIVVVSRLRVNRVIDRGAGSEMQVCASAPPWDVELIYFFIFNNLLNKTIKTLQKQSF